MPIFRIERTKDYTVMCNYHLKDARLTLKAKGLLSIMLSLPENWNYSIRGLAAICKEGVDAVGAALKELETTGYMKRNQLRGEHGRIADTEYIIYEKPYTVSPDTENPDMDEPGTENPAKLNINKSSIKELNTKRFNIHSIPICEEWERKEEVTNSAVEAYREIIQENIAYALLSNDADIDSGQLDEITDLILETVCTAKKTIRIAGDDFPSELVKSKLLKLNDMHIRFVLDCMKENTSEIKNIKKYLLAVLFNAPSTMESYYSARVRRDEQCDG